MTSKMDIGRVKATPRCVCNGIVSVLSVWLGCGLAQGAELPKRIEIASGGQSAYAIVVPDNADQGRIMQAANLLQSVILEASGAKLSIIKESAAPAGAPAIYLGKSQAAAKASLPLDTIKDWNYLLKGVGKDVFIVGDDGVYDIKDATVPVEHIGTLKGVIAFVEGQFGVRFLLPGEFGRRVPKADPLSIDAKLNSLGEQRFTYVIGRAPNDRVNGVAMNLFKNTPKFYAYGGHSYYSAVPEKEYGKTHPEYFALRGGLRTSTGNHLCISNPEVQELILKELEKVFDRGYLMALLGQTDGYAACQCDTCVAIHPDEGERLWIVHRKLAEAMNKRRPGKKVVLLSYGPTVSPPTSFKTFPDNVVIQMCDYSPKAFEQWTLFNVDKTVYIYNWVGNGPVRSPRYVVDQIRSFVKNRVAGIYLCGGFRPLQCYGLNGPAFYAFGKALENPGRESRDVLDEYVNSLFGEAAVPMRAFYRAMYERLDTVSLFNHPNIDNGGVANTLATPEDFYCHCFPAKLLNDMGLNLSRAIGMAKDERVKAALQMVEMEFKYVNAVASIFQVYRAYRVNPCPASLDLLAGKMSERQALLDDVYGGTGKCARSLPGGLPLFYANMSRDEAVMNGLGNCPPFNWDFALLKEKGVLPGATKPKRLEAAKVGAFTPDGALDKPVWKDIPFQELGEVGMGKTLNVSRFKVAYDDEAFYVAVECEYSVTDWLDRLKPMGRDGNAWAQECMEILLDPYGERERHCQFVFNPIPGSTYDARHHYIDDPLHPLFGKREVSWNGDWEYVAVIDKEKKRWTGEVRIPFKTLGVEPAKPGAMWTMNIARSEWPTPRGEGKGAKKGSEMIYSTWSPNLEGRSFHDRASYGEVVFK